MTKQKPRVPFNITLPIETKVRAENIAHAMGISASHLIEGLIMGLQIVPGQKEEKK